ncbi:IclR family transcriptional regulator [Nocardia sp. NPDC004340]
MTDDHTVVGRVVAILDAVADAPAPLPLRELTRRTGIPKPTVRRIANDLVARGMLVRTEDGYWAGSRLMNQGLQSAYQQRMPMTVQPYLQELHYVSRGEIAWYATVHDGSLVTVGAAFGPRYAAAMQRGWWPNLEMFGNSAVLFASGRLQFAHAPDRADRVLSTGWSPMTPQSVTDRHTMTDLLKQAYDTGYTEEQEQVALGYRCAAAALRDDAGRLTGVVGVTGCTNSVTAADLRTALSKSADGLERDIREVVGRVPDPATVLPSYLRLRSGVGYTWPALPTATRVTE